MSRPALRALLLAAGRGERLRPLTDSIPKPLLPVAGRSAAARTLDALVAAGCDAIAINLHHLGERIRETLGDTWRGVPLVYSEEALLLGTLGAIAPLREFLGASEEFVVVNGDSLCRWPLARLLAAHRRGGAAATLLAHRNAPPRAFGGGVALEGGRIVAFRPDALEHGAARTRRVFAGAAVLSRRLLPEIPDGPGDSVADLYDPLLARGETIRAVETSRAWHDLGTPRRLLEGVLDFALAPLASGASWAHPEARVDPEARVRASVVEAGASVERGARLRAALVLPGAVVGSGARLERVVVAPGARVASEMVLADALVAGSGVILPFASAPPRRVAPAVG